MELRYEVTIRYAPNSGGPYLHWESKSYHQHNEAGPAEAGRDGEVFWMLGDHCVLRSKNTHLYKFYRSKKGTL